MSERLHLTEVEESAFRSSAGSAEPAGEARCPGGGYPGRFDPERVPFRDVGGRPGTGRSGSAPLGHPLPGDAPVPPPRAEQGCVTGPRDSEDDRGSGSGSGGSGRARNRSVRRAEARRQRSDARAVRRRQPSILDREAGMATAEYAIATLAAVGFAALLVAVLSSGEIKGLLMSLITSALSFG